MVAKQRDMVQISFLAPTRDVPDRIRLKDCGLSYIGQDHELSVGMITGVYGASSKQAALVAASKWTRQHQASSAGINRVLMVDLNYRVDNYQLTRDQARMDTVKETGWIHFDRIGAAYRDEMRDMWVDWICKDTGTDRASIENKSLPDLALEFPRYVTKTIKKDKSIRCIVHPVYPNIDSSLVLWVATLRYEPDRFEDVTVRFLPDIKVQL